MDSGKSAVHTAHEKMHAGVVEVKSFTVRSVSCETWEGASLLSQWTLVLMRRKALRKRVWFTDLSRMERALVDLTVRCVERVRSSTLAAMLRSIVKRVAMALRSPVEQLTVEVGGFLARKFAALAASWGHSDALTWASDGEFARYLAIMHINAAGGALD